MFGDTGASLCSLGSASRSGYCRGCYILQHKGNLVAKGVKALPDGLQSLPANSGHCIMEMHCGVFFVGSHENCCNQISVTEKNSPLARQSCIVKGIPPGS